MIGGAMGAVWGWIKKLFEPFEATKEQMDGATKNGSVFGEIIGGVLKFVVKLITWSVQAFVGLGEAIGTAIGWVVVNGSKVIEWLSNTWSLVSDAVKAPFVSAFSWISDKFDAFVEKWKALKAKLGFGDNTAAPQGISWNTGAGDDAQPPSRFAIDNRPPLRAVSSTGKASINNFPITIVQQPGQDAHAVARIARDEIANHQRAQSAASRSRLGDMA